MYLQHKLSSSGLVVLLQQWMQADHGAPASADVAQELGQWLSTVDAVTLSRSLHAIDSFPEGLAPDAAGVDMVALEAAFEGTQAELTALASSKPVPAKPARERADNTRAQAPDPQAEAEYGFHAPRYLGLQKQMDAKLLGLRAQVRHGVSQGSRRLRQLAALDTVMEQLSFVREQRLWASLSAHLDRRLVQLRRAHQERLSAQCLPDEPLRWRQPGGWLHAFERDMQALLLAEMHVRLQPILGLLEAARNENMERHE